MVNPFDVIIEKLEELKGKLSEVNKVSPIPSKEIIDRAELCKRLNLTEPSVIRWEKKGAIPCFRIGSSVRYDWVKVLESLEKRGMKE